MWYYSLVIHAQETIDKVYGYSMGAVVRWKPSIYLYCLKHKLEANLSLLIAIQLSVVSDC